MTFFKVPRPEFEERHPRRRDLRLQPRHRVPGHEERSERHSAHSGLAPGAYFLTLVILPKWLSSFGFVISQATPTGLIAVCHSNGHF